MTLRLNGSASGYTELEAAPVAGNNKITLPASSGSSGQILKNSNGVLDWSQIRENEDGSISLVAGTAAAPSLSFTGDLNTGIYSPGADQLALSTNGTGRLFVDASGRVGIGTASPAAPFDCSIGDRGLQVSAVTASHVQLTGTQGSTGSNLRPMRLAAQTLSFNTGASTGTSYTERVLIDADGNIGIGTASAAANIHVLSSSGSEVRVACSIHGSHLNFWEGNGVSGNADTARLGVGKNNTALIYTNNSGTARAAFAIGTSAAEPLVLSTNNTERARIDSSGRLLVGTSSARSNFAGNTATPLVQIEGVTAATASSSVVRGAADATGPTFNLGKTRGASVGQHTVVVSGDQCGVITFQGADGTNLIRAAQIEAAVDGTPGLNDMPGRIVLSTTADGASTPTERLRITSAGLVGVGTTSPVEQLHVSGSSAINARFESSGTTASIRFANSAANDGYIGYTNQNLTFTVANSERARIDSSGRLLVGTSSAVTTSYSSGLIQLATPTGGIIVTSRDDSTVGTSTIIGGLSLWSKTTTNHEECASIFAQADGTYADGDKPTRLVFSTTADGASSPTERMRIINDGGIYIGKTSGAMATKGIAFEPYATTRVTTDSTGVDQVCLYLNRQSSDGVLLKFFQENTEEGNISVSGTTVSYNGAHLSRWSQLPSGAERTEILRGTVLSNIDEMCEWGEEDNEQLNRMKVSDVEGDKNVSGVFQAWDDDDDTYTNDFYCAMTGDFIIRIAAGITVERGDLLMSAGDGTAKPQDDDIIRSKTIAKVTSTNVSCTYHDGSYCVPCVLMAC